jgi:hypothetical protein
MNSRVGKVKVDAFFATFVDGFICNMHLIDGAWFSLCCCWLSSNACQLEKGTIVMGMPGCRFMMKKAARVD